MKQRQEGDLRALGYVSEQNFTIALANLEEPRRVYYKGAGGLFLECDSKRAAAKSRMGKASEEHNQIKNKAGLLCGLNLKSKK